MKFTIIILSTIVLPTLFLLANGSKCVCNCDGSKKEFDVDSCVLCSANACKEQYSECQTASSVTSSCASTNDPGYISLRGFSDKECKSLKQMFDIPNTDKCYPFTYEDKTVEMKGKCVNGQAEISKCDTGCTSCVKIEVAGENKCKEGGFADFVFESFSYVCESSSLKYLFNFWTLLMVFIFVLALSL